MVIYTNISRHISGMVYIKKESLCALWCSNFVSITCEISYNKTSQKLTGLSDLHLNRSICTSMVPFHSQWSDRQKMTHQTADISIWWAHMPFCWFLQLLWVFPTDSRPTICHPLTGTSVVFSAIHSVVLTLVQLNELISHRLPDADFAANSWNQWQTV